MTTPEITAETSESWRQYLVRGAVAVAVAALLMLGLYAAVRIHTIARLQTEMAQLTSHVADTDAQHDAMMVQAAARLDDLERFVFGDVVAKLQEPAPTPAPAGPSRVQLWQRNRDQELRTRLKAIEDWRYSVDQWRQRVDRWRRDHEDERNHP